jgi:hypothetical protein
MSVEEIKEFMEEQRKRFSSFGSDDDYDDYYDNDAEIDYGDDPNDEDDATQPTSTSVATPSRVLQAMPSPSHQTQVFQLISFGAVRIQSCTFGIQKQLLEMIFNSKSI